MAGKAFANQPLSIVQKQQVADTRNSQTAASFGSWTGQDAGICSCHEGLQLVMARSCLELTMLGDWGIQDSSGDV